MASNKNFNTVGDLFKYSVGEGFNTWLKWIKGAGEFKTQPYKTAYNMYKKMFQTPLKSNKPIKNDNATKNAIPYDTQTIDSTNLEDLMNKYMSGLGGGSGSSSGGGGGASAGKKIDLTPMINSLTAATNAQKKTISDTYAANRNQLAQQLKQYQENNTLDKQRQMAAFNSARADLEEQAYMNMRAAQQSAAARGLGGSGLQQLAQLSSQIQGSKATSDLTAENTDTMNSLIKALKDYTDEINTKTSDYTTAERNALKELDAELGSQIAQMQYQEEVRYQEALQAASALNAQLAAQTSSRGDSLRQAALELALQDREANEGANSALYSAYLKGLDNLRAVYNKNSNKKTSKLTKIMNDALTSSNDLLTTALGNYGNSQYANDLTDKYLKQLEAASRDYANRSTYKGLFG